MKKFTLLFPNFKQFEFLSVIPHQHSLSLGYICAMLEKHHISHDVIDAAAENLSINKIIERIKRFNPNYVGITVNISIAYAALTTALHIRKELPMVKIIFGGPWATAEADFIIKRHFGDIVVLGEGEYTVIDIAKVDPLDYDALSKVNGICFNSPSGMIITPPRPFIERLDDLPFPSWRQFPRKGYTRSSRERDMFPFITSRGCPYSCINCTKIIHGKKMRYRSVENMLEELDYLKRLGAKEIAIEDDAFNLDLKRIKNLMREIIRRKYNFRIQLSNGIRADNIDLELARFLYNAGVYRVALGIESGSQKVVDFIQKDLNLMIVPKAIEILHIAHIKVAGYFIMGFPIETLQSLLHTIDFADRINLDVFAFMTLVVFPKTALYEYLTNHTNYAGDKNPVHRIMNYQYAPLQFTTRYLTEKNLKKVKAYYFIRTYVNPRKFLQFVSSYTLMEFVRQMLINIKIYLKRMILPSIVV